MKSRTWTWRSFIPEKLIRFQSLQLKTTGFTQLPQEGTLIWYECFASVSQKPLSVASVAFLNFINRADVAAKNAEDVWYATANKAAMDLMSEEYLEDHELFS